MFTEGAYKNKGQNKPRGAESVSPGAWTTSKLVSMGLSVRNGFEDVVLLRQVHRYVDENADIPVEKKGTVQDGRGRVSESDPGHGGLHLDAAAACVVVSQESERSAADT